MEILADLHHFGLYRSLELLFGRMEGREIFRPIGMDWRQEGFWNVGKADDLAECLLSTEDGRAAQILNKYEVLPLDWAVFSLHLPRIGKISKYSDGLYEVEDKSSGSQQRAITLERFKETRFCYIISSMPQHFEPFERLRKLYQPQAKHIHYQSGIGAPIPAGAKNIILNSEVDSIWTDKNVLRIRQEFDTKIFNWRPPCAQKVVRSYVHFPQTEELWKKIGLDWDFKFIGKTLGPVKNVIVNLREMADTIANSGFTVAIKPGGESFGHVIHHSYAIGRPVIINRGDFGGTCAADLLTDDTCIDIDGKTPEQIKYEIETWAEPAVHEEICKKVRQQFEKVVDFDRDEQATRDFFKRLL